jgi:hypothetical protein
LSEQATTTGVKGLSAFVGFLVVQAARALEERADEVDRDGEDDVVDCEPPSSTSVCR